MLNVSKTRAVQGPDSGGRVRPEPALQEALRERVRHARRRAVRRADRRLRVHQPPRGHRACWARCRTSPPPRSARSSRPPAPSCSASTAGTELAKPRDLAKIFELGRVHQVEVVPRLGRLAVRRPWRCPACWPACPTARRPSRSRSSTSRKRRRRAGAAQSMDHNNYSWMNAAYAMGTRLTDAFAKYGCCTAIRGVEGGGKVEGLPAHTFTDRRRRRRPEVPDRDRHHRPPRVRAVQPRLPAAVSTTRTPTTPCSSAPSRPEAQEVRPAGRHRQRRALGPACRTSWPSAGSPTT